MKFGRQLIEEQGGAPLEFREGFIRYKALKKYLKFRQLNRISQAEGPGGKESLDNAEADKDFLRMLYKQLREVDRIFEREAKKVLTEYEIANSDCGCFLAILRCRPNCCLPQDPIDVALKARWCRRYAELNYIALRKIAKKRDRLLGGRVGEEFMQACFRGEMEARKFMSASLLAELQAIETIMTEQAKASGHDASNAVERTSQQDEEMKSVAMTSPVAAEMSNGETEIESEYMCAICLDVLYQPVSLSCGHKFCARCALATAIGSSNLVGNAEQLLMSMACYSTERPCPCCRAALYGSRQQKRSPFYDIKRLNKLEDLIKLNPRGLPHRQNVGFSILLGYSCLCELATHWQMLFRYPEEWERRKAEDAAQQAELKSTRPSTWDSLRHILT